MRRIPRLIVVAVVAWLAAAPAATASPTGFVYALDPATGCSSCAGPQVLVFDGGTTRLVTRIPLPKSAIPSGITVSADGAHVYVINFAGANSSLSVIDARHHQLVATYSLGNVAGEAVARADDSAVFIRSGKTLFRFDTASHAIATVAVGNGGGVAYSGATDRVFVGVSLPDGSGYVTEHDPLTLAEIRRVALGSSAAGLTAARNGGRLYVVHGSVFPPGQPLQMATIDAATMTVVGDRALPSVAGYGSPAAAPARGVVYASGRTLVEVPDASSGALTTIPLTPATTAATGLTIPPGQKYLFITAARQDATGFTAVAALDLDTRQIVSTYPLDNPPGVDLITSTPDGAASCTYRVSSAYASLTQIGDAGSPGRGAPIVLNTDCAWQASASATWVHLSTSSGPGAATITVTADPNSTGQIRQAQVTVGGQLVTVTQAAQNSQPAFGVIDTPADNVSGVSGAIAITGWALDDVGVKAVHIYRDPAAGEPATQIPIGLATLVEGARPDVQAAYPALPFASRGGWGYMLLTNTLPGGGNGAYRIYVYIEDVDGHSTFLGARTINTSNSAATLPFGAIDTPGQGDTVSGVITNFGWALTPQPGSIPADGSTIDVVIDGAVVGHPTYGLDRSDIAGLFPGYANTHSAVGYFTIDTTTLTNGVHTIAWVLRDSLGRAQGIGSRYFTVQNP